MIFVCGTQNEYLQNHSVPSSRVNDNICDCCDGSDEYGNILLLAVKFSGFIRQVNTLNGQDSKIKCLNSCDDRIKKSKAIIQMKIGAKLLKKPYLIEGQSKNAKV
jgi:hypothetical protein